MSDPRMAAINNFTVKQHKSVPSELNPRDAVLPDPFTVCIMGASRGIGEHIAYAYAQAGASRIVISSRATSDLETVARNISDDINSRVKVDLVECDVSSASAVEALAEYVRTRCGRLDLLVLNAGYAGPVTTRMDQGKPEWVRRAFEVNAMGTYLAAHYFVPLLLESPNGAKGFIAVGSFAGCIRRGIIANTGYTVSKMAQIRLVEYLDEQYGQYGLVSLVVHPGAVATKMAEGNTPEEFLPYLTDDVDLCGTVCVWLSKQFNNIHWLSGRLISATWDMAELMSKEQQIREKDLLKFVMVTG